MDAIYELARKRIVRKKRFYQHLTIYLGVILFLFLLNVLGFIRNGWTYVPGENTERLISTIINYPNWWFPYPALSWGLLLFIHYCMAFGIPFIGQYDEKWEAESIDAEVKRIRLKAQGLGQTKQDDLELKTLQKEMPRSTPLKDAELL